MKIWKKFVLFSIAVISIVLSFSRYYIVKNNFLNAIENTSKQNANRNMIEKYMIETNIIKIIQDGEEITDEKIIESLKSLDNYTGNQNEDVAIFDENYNEIYSNIENIEKIDIKELLEQKENSYCLKTLEDRNYMLFPSNWNINNKIIYIVNFYDVSQIYEEKDRQISEIFITDIIILMASSIVVLIFSLVAEHIESKVNSLNLQVKQKNDFINAFTHELKTPMTAMVGYSDMLRLKKCDEEVSKKALNYIYQETKRLENLSLKLMKLMSLTEDKIEFENFEIREFIEKISKKFEIKIDLDLEKQIVQGDKELLEVVMRNLIENSKNAEPKDNKVLIRGKKLKNRKYKISVIDTGKGIPKEHIKRVTEDFYMVDKSRSRENNGSGIGLSLVKKILELHKSKLDIESEENVGTTVSFELEEGKDEN